MDMLERKDFQRVVCDPILAGIMDDDSKVASEYCLCVTSGTSGKKPMLAVMSGRSLPEWIGGSKRRVTCIGSRNLRLRNTVMMRNDPDSRGSAVLNPDEVDIIPELSELLRDYRPDSIRGVVSFATFVSQNVPDDVCGEVTTIHIAGEMVTKARTAFLNSRFPAARIRMTYNLTEMYSAISFPSCNFAPMNWYHPSVGVTVEVHEPDESGYGDLLITKQLTSKVVARRYRSGDVGRLHGACKCGAKITFEIAGRRGYDYVKIGGLFLRREELDRVFSLCPDLVDDYRVDVSEEIIKGRIVGKILLRVFRRNRACDEKLKMRIIGHVSQNLFMTQTRTLEAMTTEGYIAPLDVEFSPIPFPSGFKDVKIRQHTHKP